MSANQWALKWPYQQRGGPLPTLNDTLPDPFARLQNLAGMRQATMQDTGGGWTSAPAAPNPSTPGNFTPRMADGPGSAFTTDNNSWSAPSTQVPTTAPSTTGGAASGYTGNPWLNYNSGNPYAGGDQYYNAGADRAKWDLAQTGAGSEDDRSRVWRWTLDALGPNAGKASPATVQAAYLAAIKRLRDDYNAPENANKGGWASSPFAGYTQFIGGQQGGGTGAPAPAATPTSTTSPQAGTVAGAAQAAGNAATGAGTQTGGNGVSIGMDPTNGTGGTGGNQNPQPGQPGYGGFFNLQNPQQAVRDYINQHFGQGAADTNMFFGDWVKKLFGNLIPTIMQLTTDANGKPALDRLANLGGVMDPLLFGGSGTLGGNLQNFASQAQSNLIPNMGGMNASTQADLLRNLTALRTLGQNPYMQEATDNRLNAAIGSAQDQASQIIRSGGKMPNNYSLWDYINNQLPQGYVNPLQR